MSRTAHDGGCLTNANEALDAQKSAARAEARGLLRALDTDERAKQGLQICAQAAAEVAKTPGPVAAFFPMGSEPDIRTLLVDLATNGRLLLPRMDGTTIGFAYVSDLDSLTAGAWGFRAPPENSPLVTPVIAIIPGIAFGRDGSRLGRGAGHYDRFLSTHPQVLRIGVGFSTTLRDSVPHGPLDMQMDIVVVGGETVRITPRRAE